MMLKEKNSKHEIRNSKQIQITKIQMTKNKNQFRILKFEFRNCFEFRYSDFGFGKFCLAKGLK
jgi:hypothetical protein